MKHTLLYLLALGFASSLLGQQSSLYDLSFSNAGFSGTTFCVEIYLSFNQSNDSLGSSNLVFDFDQSVISNPVLASHTLTGPPFYQVPTVTTPNEARTSFNIELGSPFFGDEIAGSTGQTLLGQVCFDYPTSGVTVSLDWYVNGTAGTVVYLDNESAQLAPGTLTNYSGIPVSFPVEWLDFDAVLAGEHVQLDWTTAAEVNNSHFEIERSFDGGSFDYIGQVAGVGNSTDAQAYQFMDRKVAELGQSQLYYRLRQVDLDGQFSLSEVVEFQLSDLPILSVEGYPNPFHKQLWIQYANISEKPFTLVISNGIGQEIWRSDQLDRAGKVQVPTTSWAQGMYFLSAENETDKVVVEVLKR